jgi:hypothetical protein
MQVMQQMMQSPEVQQMAASLAGDTGSGGPNTSFPLGGLLGQVGLTTQCCKLHDHDLTPIAYSGDECNHTIAACSNHFSEVTLGLTNSKGTSNQS